jgi:uncharacterized membrane protein YeaQ/YmgE (transglycosylase-associated protein family)
VRFEPSSHLVDHHTRLGAIDRYTGTPLLLQRCSDKSLLSGHRSLGKIMQETTRASNSTTNLDERSDSETSTVADARRDDRRKNRSTNVRDSSMLERREGLLAARVTGARSMDATAIIVMLVIGAIVGFLANAIVAGPWGMLGYIVAGIVGSFVAGWLLRMSKVDLKLGHPLIPQIIIAAIGAIIAISIIAIGSGPI